MSVTIEKPAPSAPKPPTTRRSWVRRALLGFLITAVVLVFAAIGLIWWTSSRIDRIPGEDLQALDPVGADVRTFLLVGSDSRENLPDDLPDAFGPAGGKRADVIMLVHVVPGGGRVQMLSIPRDLKVDIPGNGINKINAAYAFGGPELLIQTVKNATGIPVHHYVEIGFGGFARIVESIGGVTIDFPYPARDLNSGLLVDAGEQRLSGAMALAYARSRHYEELRDGSWVAVDANDIGRTQRQQAILTAILSEASSPSNIVRLPDFMGTFADNVTADDGLDTGLLTRLAFSVRSVRGDDFERMTLPVVISNEGGTSYVVPVEPWTDVVAAFEKGEPMSVAAGG